MSRINSQIKKEIIKIINKHIGNNFLLIAFGSLAKNQIKRSSDLDLALYKEGGLSTQKILEIKEELDTEVHTLREIDLINLGDENLDPGLLKNILEGGLIWHRAKNSKELLKNLRRRLINTKK